jgi:hypothetical protein
MAQIICRVRSLLHPLTELARPYWCEDAVDKSADEALIPACTTSRQIIAGALPGRSVAARVRAGSSQPASEVRNAARVQGFSYAPRIDVSVLVSAFGILCRHLLTLSLGELHNHLVQQRFTVGR